MKSTKPTRKPLVLPAEKSVMPMGVTDYIMMFYGPPGVGKTTFVNGLGERGIFISTDRGSRTLNALRVECNDYESIISAVIAIQSAPKPYDFVVIDHVDDVARWTEDAVCEQLGVDALADAEWGKGWSEFAKKMSKLVTELKKCPGGLVFIAHETIKTIRAQGIEKEVVMPEMAKRTYKMIVPLCDLVGYCTFKRIKSEKTGKMTDRRILITQPDGHIYCKDRTARTKPTGVEYLDGQAFIETFSS